jgi:epoxyqueuosine reductase
MDSLKNTSFSEAIKAKAKQLGFFSCGIAKAEFLEEEAERLKLWLDKGSHAGMDYMANHFEKRTDPRRLLENARSVIMVLYNYFPKEKFPEKDHFKIAKYAYGKDYHTVMKKKLNKLLDFIMVNAGEVNARIFVDSAPVLERAWAVRSGLGWIGKNTSLITKAQGSFFFIGEIICDLELEYNNYLEPDHCGGCTRCIETCPTKALKPYHLDANRCISYWTIENKGDHIPAEFNDKFEDCIFGCDICQDVCPWNRLSEPHNEEEFLLTDGLKKMNKTDWQNLSQGSFRSQFKDSAVKRAGYDGLKRNIRFLSGNSTD